MVIITQNQFSEKCIIFYWRDTKIITVDTWNYHWIFILELSIYGKILTVFVPLRLWEIIVLILLIIFRLEIHKSFSLLFVFDIMIIGTF